MRLQVAYPDPEKAVVDLLEERIADHEPGATVGVGVPTGWKPTSPPHFEVAWDGTPIIRHPVAAHCTVRVAVRAASPSEVKRLAWLAHGLLTAHDGEPPLAVVLPLAGPTPAIDPDTHADLCWFTVRATVRSTPIVSV